LAILDYGCGDGLFGYFLAQNKLCKEVVLCDWFTEAPNELVKGMYMHSERLVEQHKKYFDIILLRHVLEHTKSPLEFINHLVLFLKDDGRLVIEIPRLESIWVKLFRSKCINIVNHEHLVFFNKQSLLFHFQDKYKLTIKKSSHILLGRTLANSINIKITNTVRIF